MRTKTTARPWRRRRRWEDRQWLAVHDPRVLVELDAIVDRAMRDVAAEEAQPARWW